MAVGDFELKRATSIDLTITLASLGDDSSLLAGAESNAVESVSPTIDYLLSGKITTGEAPSDDRKIEVWVYASMNDVPDYPAPFDGVASAETVGSAAEKHAALHLAAIIPTDDTPDKTYYFAPISVASLFGGMLPKFWGVFITQGTSDPLHATAGNHKISAVPIYGHQAQT